MPASNRTQKSRNPLIAPGVHKYGKAAAFGVRGEYKKLKLRKAVAAATGAQVAKAVETTGIKKVDKKGKEYVVYKGVSAPVYGQRPARPTHLGKHKVHHPSVATLRSSITPGTVLILLAGHFRGKRVVFLKRLESGLLLVTGPYKLNGVPIRRVNQSYVIATSTKIDISGVKIPEHINDSYFAKEHEADKPKSEGEFFKGSEQKAVKKTVKPARITDQQTVDDQLKAIIDKTATLNDYLSARFTLTHGLLPHEIKF